MISSSMLQEFLVPIGLHVVDVEARLVIERQLERAGYALIGCAARAGAIW